MKVAADTGNRRLMEDVTRDFPARAFLMYQRIETPEPESAPKERVRMEVSLDRAQKSCRERPRPLSMERCGFQPPRARSRFSAVPSRMEADDRLRQPQEGRRGRK